MIKEVKYFVFIFIIVIFIFFTSKYYFSDAHKKKSYRSITGFDKKINLYSKKLPILKNNTNNIIEYVKSTQTKKKKNYHFWKLIDNNE